MTSAAFPWEFTPPQAHQKTYQPFASAAKINEYPLFFSEKLFNKISINECFSKNIENGQKVKRIAIKMLGILSFYLTIPISIALTPITIITDIVVGTIEAIYMHSKKSDPKKIKELLWNKLLASPIQQLVSVSVKIVLFAIFGGSIALAFYSLFYLPEVALLDCGLLFFSFFYLWPIYAASIDIINYLPKKINQAQFDIFIKKDIPRSLDEHLSFIQFTMALVKTQEELQKFHRPLEKTMDSCNTFLQKCFDFYDLFHVDRINPDVAVINASRFQWTRWCKELPETPFKQSLTKCIEAATEFFKVRLPNECRLYFTGEQKKKYQKFLEKFFSLTLQVDLSVEAKFEKKFEKLKQTLLECKSPFDVFELSLSDSIKKDDLENKHRKLLRSCHSDIPFLRRNQEKAQEAQKIRDCINAAHGFLLALIGN